MSSIPEYYWEELECPVCMEYMRPPIKMCKIGHSICHNCHAKTQKCPQCQSPFTDTRNFALESLYEKVPKPCKNSLYGCTYKSKEDQIGVHETTCSFAPKKCPMSLSTNKCNFKASMIPLLKDHLYDKHSSIISEITNHSKIISFKHTINPVHSANTKSLYLVDMNYNFFLIIIQELENFFKWNVFAIGAPHVADRFDYELSIKHCNAGRRGIFLGGMCNPAYFESVEFDEGNTSHYISRFLVDDCLDAYGTLFFSFRIIE